MQKVLHREIQEFTYDTEEERLAHVHEMQQQGWYVSGKVRRIKPGVSIWDANDENSYQWFAEYFKNH